MMAPYRKAVAAFLTSAVSLAALFVPGIEAYLTPEILAAVASIAAPLLVYALPNA